MKQTALLKKVQKGDKKHGPAEPRRRVSVEEYVGHHLAQNDGSKRAETLYVMFDVYSCEGINKDLQVPTSEAYLSFGN